MEKTEIHIRTNKVSRHSFYCDGCQKHLGTTEEYEDGWYPELGKFELSIYLPSGWYRVEKCFCNDCKKKYLNELLGNLKARDFKKDN